ncbi:MAG: hypothetical protein V3V88_00080 [Dehalococcoidia bacterium]
MGGCGTYVRTGNSSPTEIPRKKRTREEIRKSINDKRQKLWARIKRRCTSRLSEKCIIKGSLAAFPNHGKGEKGTVCKPCKNEMAKRRRRRDAVARFRHYIVSRLKNEWEEDEIPVDIYSGLEDYLGYKLTALKRHLRLELKEREGITLIKSFELGYHLDHRKPHKSFNMTEIGDAEFKKCWGIENLWMIPAEVNLKKGAREDFFR